MLCRASKTHSKADKKQYYMLIWPYSCRASRVVPVVGTLASRQRTCHVAALIIVGSAGRSRESLMLLVKATGLNLHPGRVGFWQCGPRGGTLSARQLCNCPPLSKESDVTQRC